jgi:hypothetical protein
MLAAALTVSLCTSAWAGGLQAKSSRAPLSAREVERPLVLPKGWLDVAVSTERELAGVPGEWMSGVAFRQGLFPRHELSLALAESGSRLGWRWTLMQTEVPAASVALETEWRGPAEAVLGLAARRQLGGLRLTGRVAGVYSYISPLEAGGIASVEALLQAGPLVFSQAPELSRVGARPVSLKWGFRWGVQWTRGFDTWITAALPVMGARSRQVGFSVGGRF